MKTDIQISKTLSYYLRHGAAKEGLSIRPDGYLLLSDLLGKAPFRGITIADIQRVVRENDKQRYELSETEPFLIRARQGHTLTTVVDAGYERITSVSEQQKYAVHGTYLSLKDKLWASPGLSRMQRQHVHMTPPELAFSDVVIKGLSRPRQSADLFLWVNLHTLLSQGMTLLKSSNGVLLSSGNADGFIPWTCIDRCTDRQQQPLPFTLPSPSSS